MTSRQYPENDQLSPIQEHDENSYPANDLNLTPRTIYVPPKKPRISRSPLSSGMQPAMASSEKLPERNISSILGNSSISFLEEKMQTFVDKKCDCNKFESVLKEYQAVKERFQTYIRSKNLTITPLDSNSFLGAPLMSFLGHEAKVYAENNCQCDQFKDILKQYSALLVDLQSNDEKVNLEAHEQTQAGENVENEVVKTRLSILEKEMQTFGDKTCSCEKFELVLKELQAHRERFQIYVKSKTSSNLDSNCTSFLGASQISFLEHEAQVYAENDCQCNRFQNIVKEYNALQTASGNIKVMEAEVNNLKQKFDDYEKNEATFIDENKILQEKLQIAEQKESESRSACEKLKAEIDVLKNEKNVLNYICVGKGVEIQQFKEQKQQLENILLPLRDQLTEANEKIENLQTTLTNGKQKFFQLQETLKEKDEEIKALKDVKEDSSKSKNEVQELKKKIDHYKKKLENSEAAKELLQSDKKELQKKKKELEKRCAIQDSEIRKLKDTVEKEKAVHRKQLSEINDKYLNEAAGYKKVVENLQSEIQTLQASIGDTALMREEIVSLNNKIQMFEQKMASDERDLAKTTNDVALLQSEMKHLELQISLKEAGIAELKENAATSSSSSNNEIEYLRTEITKLRQQQPDTFQSGAVEPSSSSAVASVLTQSQNESVSQFLEEIQRKSRHTAKNARQKKNGSLNADYNAEESCNTQ